MSKRYKIHLDQVVWGEGVWSSSSEEPRKRKDVSPPYHVSKRYKYLEPRYRITPSSHYPYDRHFAGCLNENTEVWRFLCGSVFAVNECCCRCCAGEAIRLLASRSAPLPLPPCFIAFWQQADGSRRSVGQKEALSVRNRILREAIEGRGSGIRDYFSRKRQEWG